MGKVAAKMAKEEIAIDVMEDLVAKATATMVKMMEGKIAHNTKIIKNIERVTKVHLTSQERISTFRRKAMEIIIPAKSHSST